MSTAVRVAKVILSWGMLIGGIVVMIMVPTQPFGLALALFAGSIAASLAPES